MVDVNKPIENPKLVAALEAFRGSPNVDTEAFFFEELRSANFLFILEKGLVHDEPDSEGMITLKKETIISFPMFSNPDGHPLFFGFTDWPSLYAWREQENQQTLIVTFEDVAGMVLRDGFECSGFVINPSTHDFLIPREIIAHVSGRPSKYKVEKDTKVLLGVPNEYPKELVEAVSKKLEEIEEVSCAWLLLMKRDEQESYLIILEHNGDRDTISQIVGNTALKYTQKGMFVDIITTNQEFGANAVKNQIPFFKR